MIAWMQGGDYRRPAGAPKVVLPVRWTIKAGIAKGTQIDTFTGYASEDETAKSIRVWFLNRMHLVVYSVQVDREVKAP